MGFSIRFVAVLAAVLAAQASHGLHFPHGKTLVYKYYADVKAGTIEPAAYASQFTLEGTLHVKHETSDPSLTDAYYVALSDVKTGMYNGAAKYSHRIDVLNPIDEAASVLQRPFLIMYDGNGLLQGVKISKNEAGWSKNMKMAIASMLQLDLSKINVDTPKKSQNFISKEHTIHGDCSVDYNIYPKGQQPIKNFIIKKFSSPMNCTGFEVHSFNHVDIEDCLPVKDSLNTDSKRVLEIEKQDEEIIIKKLFAQGGVNYLPWNKKSKAHYVLTNSTFNLERIAPASDIDLPIVNFKKVPMIRDVTYQKSQERYAPNAAVDLTHGRHVVNLKTLVSEVKKMLEEAVDYTGENHLKVEVPNWKHGQTINRILHAMSYMDIASLELVFHTYQDSKVPRDIMIKSFFFDIIPQVGTPATSLFTMRIVRKNKVPKATAIEMLKNLPLNVKTPTEKLLVQMEDLLKMDDSVDMSVRKASILCFSTLVYRTFKDQMHPEENALLQRYLHMFVDRVKSEEDYETKVVYLMAIRNIEVGKIYDLLAPIIKGDVTISEHPVNIRLLAIWAIENAVKKNVPVADKLLWPIMEDSSLPVKLRTAAYKILIHIPNDILLRRIEWFMVTEKNENFYNYHYTTINDIATSEDPCKRNLRERIEKIIRYNNKHKDTRYTLSATYSFDDYDEMFDVTERLYSGMVLNDNTKTPEVVEFEYSLASGAEAVIDTGIRVHVQGLLEEVQNIWKGIFDSNDVVTDPKVVELLLKAARDLPTPKPVSIDIVLISNGRVVLANHYDKQTLHTMYQDVMPYIIDRPKTDMNVFRQSVQYDHLSEKIVTNDMGLPVVLENRVPVVASFKFDAKKGIDMSIDLSVDLKLWRHGEYALSTYNPIEDAWHGMRRSTAVDISLPLRMNFALSPTSENLVITITPTKLPVGGILVYVKDFVTLEAEKGVEALKKSCSTCNLQEDVSIESAEKNNYSSSFDGTYLGLKYSVAVLDCEFGAEPDMSALYGAVLPTRKQPWKELVDRKKLSVRQNVKGMFLYPQIGNCGILLKFEPSQLHPVRIYINLRSKFNYTNRLDSALYILKSSVYDFHAIADFVSETNNSSILFWDLKLNVDQNDGHLLNIVKLDMALMAPGMKTFKICINAQKSYPTVPVDPLKLGVSKQETNSIVSIIGGYTDEPYECDRDGFMLTFTMKGELSEEQMTNLGKNTVSGPCSKDKKNAWYANSKTLTPFTLNCLDEAITYTTLRKYTINLAHKKLTTLSFLTELDNEDRSMLMPYVKFDAERIDDNNLKITLEFPLETDVTADDDKTDDFDAFDVSLLTDMIDMPDEVSEPFWSASLDNTRFSYNFLSSYSDNTIKLCAVYPRVTLTADYKTIPFNVPDQWTLVTGDHVIGKYAVFAKTVGDNLAVKLYSSQYVVELSPGVDNKVQVKINDKVVVEHLEEGVAVPSTDIKIPYFTVTRKNLHIVVDFGRVPTVLYYSPSHVTVTMQTLPLTGKVSGLCGHLDGTSQNKITKVYTLA